MKRGGWAGAGLKRAAVKFLDESLGVPQGFNRVEFLLVSEVGGKIASQGHRCRRKN